MIASNHKYWLRLLLKLTIVVMLLNLVVSFVWFAELIDKVLKGQIFLVVLFSIYLWIWEALKGMNGAQKITMLLGITGIKATAALIYLLPVIFGEEEESRKEANVLFFMINYLIYLNFSVIFAVQNK